jgi:glycosyltransferase involved in cell wall biosynthesis
MSRELLTKHFSLRGLIGEGLWLLRKLLKRFPKGLNLAQRVWYSWRKIIPACREKYDVAIAYMDGTPAYYVMDKVQAEKKVLWLHSDYEKQGYAPAFDARFYGACDAAVTVSAECLETLRRAHPEQVNKLHVLENISSYTMVRTASEEADAAPEFDGVQGVKLLSVGRLHPQKGMDIAVEAARCLKEQGIEFCWLIVGEGSERAMLEKKIAGDGLESKIFLLGSRLNPYAYMAKCDILVQPSRIEGKSIVLDEAKMLCVPIVATCYPTVGDAITHGENGWVTDMTGEAIAAGVLRLWQDESMRTEIIRNLENAPKGNDELLTRYIETML